MHWGNWVGTGHGTAFPRAWAHVLLLRLFGLFFTTRAAALNTHLLMPLLLAPPSCRPHASPLSQHLRAAAAARAPRSQGPRPHPSCSPQHPSVFLWLRARTKQMWSPHLSCCSSKHRGEAPRRKGRMRPVLQRCLGLGLGLRLMQALPQSKQALLQQLLQQGQPLQQAWGAPLMQAQARLQRPLPP